MKFPAILTCLLAVLLTAVPVRQARADDVSFDVFYNSLADDGDWYNTPEYGYVFQPSIAYKSDKWRPYSDGYWAQTDDGWTWVSYENFGWATYHYGRWTRLKDLGWAWVPGYDWGPGWVSWRTNDDYVGWAPLPPKAEQGAYEGRIVDNPRPRAEAVDYNDVEPEDYGSDVDVNYDIGPQNYCFVETHNFGAPVLSEVCLPPERNVVIIERTINVTNIYRRRGPDRFVVYNNGPDYNFISAHSQRPIQQLRLERHDDLNFLRDGTRGGGNANQVRNGAFLVAAPPIARRPMNFTQVKPPRVKQNLDRPQVNHGWSQAGGDPGTIQRLRDQFKQQAQQAPPPRRDTSALPPRVNEPPRPAQAGNVPPTPAANQPFRQPEGGARPPMTDEQKAARHDAAQRQREAREKAAAAGGQPVPANPAADPARGSHMNKGPAYPTNAAPAPNGQPTPTDEEKAARRARRQQEKAQQAPQNPAGAQSFERPGQPAAVNTPAAAPADPDREARRARRQQEKAAQQQAQPQPPNVDRAPTQPETQPQAPNPEREARRLQRQQERAAAAAPERVAPAAPPRVTQPQPQPQPQPEAARNPEREARRAERQQQPAAPQPQPEARNPEREARRAERQQPPAAPQQPQGTPNGKGDDKKKQNQ